MKKAFVQKCKQLACGTLQNNLDEKIVKDQPPAIDILGHTFPEEIVKKWSDIVIGDEIGRGNFSIVYQGIMHLTKYHKYVTYSKK